MQVIHVQTTENQIRITEETEIVLMLISFFSPVSSRIYIAVSVVMCVRVNEERLDVAVEAFAEFFGVREVSVSNLGEETGYHDRVFVGERSCELFKLL
jgi:hypothetical protein